ncbi:DUF1223 domain-containing protein [Phenylobacterium sp.]|uniref:DUF1223 domain-containing protein n=1 Tax=Phenylobacterium sp. TaxID=1871053 RepID=UPI0030F4B15F
MRNVALFSLLVSALPLCAQARSPVVVELFTAQGCASCGDANAYVGKLAEKPGVLALTFAVDYWNYLGWEDTFAKPAFAERQKAYVARLDLPEPYTPQVVIDGRAQVGGLQDDKIDRLVSDAVESPRRDPDMAFIGQRRVDVGSGPVPRGGAEVWLVRYDPREQDVTVRKGDNRGQTVSHRNVVVEIKRLGAWRGRPTAYRMPAASAEGLATAVIVQGPHGGRVIAAAQRD